MVEPGRDVGGFRSWTVSPTWIVSGISSAAAVDASYSSSGNSKKRRRPLSVALVTNYLLGAAAEQFGGFWTPRETTTTGNGAELLVEAAGQTALAEPLINALELQPDLVVIVPDGFENNPLWPSP